MYTANEKLWILIKASRIAGWCFGPILYCIGSLHARALPKTPSKFLSFLTQVTVLSFPLCVGKYAHPLHDMLLLISLLLVVFGVNDVYDYATDLRNPRKHQQSLEGSVLDPSKHEVVLAAALYLSCFIFLSFLLTALSRSSSFIARRTSLTLLTIMLSWQYSAPPLRLKERPFLDSCSNGALVWMIWALGYTSNGYSLFGPDNGAGAHKGWMLAFCTAGIHALGAAADIDADMVAGQCTIATQAGVRCAALFCAVC